MFAHKTVYFVTNRLAEGLPFVPNTYLNLILFGVLARASQQFPDIRICAWLFLQNHYHAILYALGDPQRIADFMNFVDGEIAKYLCRLLGKHHCKIWGREYDATPLPSPADVIEKQIYTYANPVVANLVAAASDWFGVSTFSNDLQQFSRDYKYFRPRHLRQLPHHPLTKPLLRSLHANLDRCPARTYTLTVNPLSWLECFRSPNLTPDQARQRILDGIAAIERAEARERLAKKRSLPARTALQSQNPYKHYVPQSKGRRVICISSDPLLRAEYIALYRSFCAKCKHAWTMWKDGFLDYPFPPDAFVPRRPPSAALLPAFP